MTTKSCEHCDYMSTDRSNFSRHKKYHLSVENRQFGCLLCTKKFATKSDLKRHEDVVITIEQVDSLKTNLRFKLTPESLLDWLDGTEDSEDSVNQCQPVFLQEKEDLVAKTSDEDGKNGCVVSFPHQLPCYINLF